jgi:hypothetical protein
VRRFAISLLALAVLILSWRTLSVAARCASLGDAVTYAVLGWDERTTYAAGFDEARFKFISPGDSRAEVESRLGSPLKTWPDSTDRTTTFQYSVGEATYWQRLIVFGPDQGVLTVVRRFEFD